MTRFVLSPRAQAGLDEFWEYTAAAWGIAQAELYIRKLERAIKFAASGPGLGSGSRPRLTSFLDELRYKRIDRRMEFEWDEDKHQRNYRERGFGFDFAALIFDGPVIEKRDDRKDSARCAFSLLAWPRGPCSR